MDGGQSDQGTERGRPAGEKAARSLWEVGGVLAEMSWGEGVAKGLI